MKLIPKDSSGLVKIGKSIDITNKLIKEIGSRNVVLSDDYRVSIPDANFQKYLEEQHNIVFIDKTVAYGDIKQTTKISCGNRTIESLQGLEYFTALKELWCATNLLKSLDVTKNIALTELWCSHNKLTSIDLTKNTALVKLNCVVNKLTSLDITKNRALTFMSCIKNEISSLDVTYNIALSNLYCSDNHLTSIDISKNTLLEKVSLKGNPGDWWIKLEKE